MPDVTDLNAKPPGPAPRTGGMLGRIRYAANFLLDPLGFVQHRFATYGDLYFVEGGPGASSANEPGLFVVKHPEHIREVLITNASSFDKTHSALGQIRRFLGDGLLTTDGTLWAQQRRLVAPAFSPSRMAGYADVMVDEARKQTGRFVDGETRDMGTTMMQLTLAIVGRTLFGEDVSGEAQKVATSMATFQDVAARPDFLPKWMPSPGRKRLAEGVATLDRLMFRLIDERRAEKGSERGDLLHALSNAQDADGSRLSRQQVRDQLVTLFLAGHETTSHALTWTLYLLAQHPKVRAQLEEEVRGLLGDRPVTLADLANLPYTEQVLKESMRLYPPAFMLGRAAAEDTSIGGYFVPKGSEVVVWLYMTHRDERWFPEPLVFRPERFTKQAEALIPRGAYVPFGAGPRACIGKSFAMMEASLLLATLVQRGTYRLAPGQRVEAKPRITLCPKYGMRMQVKTT